MENLLGCSVKNIYESAFLFAWLPSGGAMNRRQDRNQQ
jgi:hypothetical protein